MMPEPPVMKIAYVITRGDAVGGASIHVRDLALAMQRRGHAVEVLVGGSGPVTDLLRQAGIPYHSLRHLQRAIHPVLDLRAFLELRRSIQSIQPDLVSTHTAKAGLLGRLACRTLGIPVLYTPHGWTIGDRLSSLAGRLFTLLERLASHWCAAIVCVCEHERRLALEKRIASKRKLRVVYNGMPDICASLHAQPALHPPRLCMVARFESPKDHATLLHALAPLKDLPWQLDLVGEGPLLPEIQRLATHLALADRVHFLGYLTDPSPVLAKAQLFVLSTRSEAFPRSILEAMRAGLPVVAANVGGVSEAVSDQLSGLLVPPADVPLLTGALGNLLQNAPLRQLFGAAGRHTYADRFRLETMEAATAALYAELLDLR